MVSLSSSAHGQYTTGEVLNLLTVDISRVRYIFLELSDLINEPPTVTRKITLENRQIAIGMALQFVVLGKSALAGIAVFVLFLPVNIFSILLSRRFQVKRRIFAIKYSGSPNEAKGSETEARGGGAQWNAGGEAVRLGAESRANHRWN